jgi:hypothetical protein
MLRLITLRELVYQRGNKGSFDGATEACYAHSQVAIQRAIAPLPAMILNTA